MQEMVNTWKRDDNIRKVVGRILNGGLPNDPTCPCATNRPCQPKDYYCYAKTLYEWVRDKIMYAYDPHLVEYVESPLRVLTNRIGDCDSQDMLLCAMFEQVGLQSQFVTIKADRERPGEYSHVYTRVKIPGHGWVVADPTMPRHFGWEPEGAFVKRYWAGSSDALSLPLETQDSVSGMMGFGGLGDFDIGNALRYTGVAGIAITIGAIWVGYKLLSATKKATKRVAKSLGKASAPAARYLAEAAIRKKFGGGPQ